MPEPSFESFLKTLRSETERALRRCVPGPSAGPATLHKAMRYSLLAGGKRLRPVLCLAAADLCGGDRSRALPLACAVECVHAYSLIHDDLPCMDDDDFRRGRPTNHKVFGEAMAVLAGDALLTAAFALTASAPASRRFGPGEFTAELAAAAGSLNLIAGQAADIEAEGASRPLPLRALRAIHERKTGALIRASLALGAMSAGAAEGQIGHLRRYGRLIGLAFQVMDDILDVTQTAETLGKTAGKDVRDGKATYPALLGLEGARREARRLTRAAVAALEPFGGRAWFLRRLAERLLERDR